ncbi:MAG: tellurite resistance TerB family protein, partial [Notoacmeibacter sp.]
MSTADGERPDKELNIIADLTRNLPVFSSVTADDLILAIRATTILLEETESIDDFIEEAGVFLPKPLRETAYALAVEVA